MHCIEAWIITLIYSIVFEYKVIIIVNKKDILLIVFISSGSFDSLHSVEHSQ